LLQIRFAVNYTAEHSQALIVLGLVLGFSLV